jgi:hypothetical protein
MSRRDLLRYGVSLTAASALGGTSLAQQRTEQPNVQSGQPASKPNILFILSDNVGYGVPSCYNGGILDTPMPRIDQLAAEGLRLTNFNVGRLLDALTAAGIADDPVVIWASDNGPSPLPTVTPWWTIGDAGPWRGEIGTVLEGNIRTPCIVRWPGKIPAGRASNQIVAIVDYFPTLARIAGGKVPADRPIDGVDQLDFLMGRQGESSRDHVLLFLGQKLMAIKWRHYKIHIDGLDRVDGVIRRLVVPARLQSRIGSEGALQHHLAEHVDWRADRSVRRRLPSEREEVPEPCGSPAQRQAAALRSRRFGSRNRCGRRAPQIGIDTTALRHLLSECL